MKLNVKAFALSCGILGGLGLFTATWIKIIFRGATGNPTFVGSVLFGYNVSPLGSFIGLIWAFIIGLIGGVIFAWLYNRILGDGK